MYRLVVDLLDLAKFDAGTIILERKVLDLKEILTRVVNQLFPQAGQVHVQLTLEVEPLLTCVGDEDRLAQVFTNLVENAIKHTPQKGDVLVKAWSEEGTARIQIRDSGEGIPEEHLDRIFERFYKIDHSRKKDLEPGTGLGLAIAQQIIYAHHGKITVKSKIGEGSVFLVRFPLVKPDDTTVSIKRKEPGLS